MLVPPDAHIYSCLIEFNNFGIMYINSKQAWELLHYIQWVQDYIYLGWTVSRFPPLSLCVSNLLTAIGAFVK